MKQHVIDIADLGPDSRKVNGVFPAGSLDLDVFGVEQRRDVDWSGSISRQGGRVRLVGSLHTALNLACVRCLESSQVAVGREFDLVFEQRDDLKYERNADIELEEPDLRTAFLAGTELSLGDVMSEQLVLSLPMKPLCRTDCKGLCLECGQNLNIESCECSAPAANPAFDVLVELKQRMENERT